MNLQAEILKGLQEQFQFRKTRGSWLQEGKCPDCGRFEAFCAASEPKIVRCSRQERCGWEDSVRNLLPDLFEDWSKRFPTTEENPNAAADAYLSHERGLDMRLLRGSYTQELFRCPKSGATAATVRFKVGETTWERIIDRAGRFEKKAHFRAGGSWKGHCWVPPRLTVEELATGNDIWITEGIFDAVALCQVERPAVSAMSVNVWPEHFLAEIRAACEAKKRRDRPRLIFAFDVGNAGVTWTRKFVDRARKEGWEATAAQVRPDGEGTKLDWNDLLLRHVSWNGEGRKAPLSDEMIDEYLWNGEVTIAKTARDKAKPGVVQAGSCVDGWRGAAVAEMPSEGIKQMALVEQVFRLAALQLGLDPLLREFYGIDPRGKGGVVRTLAIAADDPLPLGMEHPPRGEVAIGVVVIHATSLDELGIGLLTPGHGIPALADQLVPVVAEHRQALAGLGAPIGAVPDHDGHKGIEAHQITRPASSG